jgi:Protein of unknown function (DUF1579)
MLPISRSLALALVAALAACQAADPRMEPAGGRAAASGPRTLQEEVATLARASRPGPMHARLRALAGRWTVSLGSVAFDQSEREEARGTAALEWVHDGRFLSWTADIEGTGTTSGFLGYDLRHAQYQLLMISSLSTGMGVATGYGDLEGEGIRFTQEIVDPPSGRRMRMTSTLRLVDADHFVLDAYGVDERGEERVLRRTHYRRADLRR